MYVVSHQRQNKRQSNRQTKTLLTVHSQTTSQHTIRLFLILVLAVGLFGGCYAYNNWQVTPEELELAALTDEADWIDFVSLIGEQVIQWFLEWTG